MVKNAHVVKCVHFSSIYELFVFLCFHRKSLKIFIQFFVIFSWRNSPILLSGSRKDLLMSRAVPPARLVKHFNEFLSGSIFRGHAIKHEQENMIPGPYQVLHRLAFFRCRYQSPRGSFYNAAK